MQDRGSASGPGRDLIGGGGVTLRVVKLLHRYVLREHAGPLGFACAALTSLMLLNYIAKQFGSLVGKGLPWTVIAEFFVLAIPFTIAMTLPMAVLVATIYATSRLAAEHEVTAMKASGVDLRVVLRPALGAGAALAGLMILFNDQVLPRANHRLRQLQTDIARKKPTFGLREQVINEVSPGQLYLRAARIQANSNRMHDVVIYDLADAVHRRTIYADSGDLAMSADRADLRMTLYHGTMQELPREHPGELQRVFYQVNHVRVRGIGNTLTRTKDDGYKGDREQSICELQAAVRQAAADRAEATVRLEQQMVNTVRLLAVGRADAPYDTARARPRAAPPSLGRAYCAALDVVSRAAGRLLPAPARAQPPAGPPTAGPGGMATPLPEVTPLVETVASQAEGHRLRVEASGQGAAGYQVEIEKKFALSVACLVFVLFGAPVALRFPRGGVGLSIGVSLGVFSLYYVGLIAGESLADRGTLSPFLAMWGTNLVFTVAGLALWRGVGRERVSGRGNWFAETWERWRDRRASSRAAGRPAGSAA